MRVASRLDAGPVYADAALPIAEHTAGSLHDALARLGADLLIRVLDDLLDGRAEAVSRMNLVPVMRPRSARRTGSLTGTVRRRKCMPTFGA